MTTLNRVESNKKPQYKDYVAFLENYRSAKKDEQNSESGYSFSLTNSSNNSSTSVNSDLNDVNCVKRTVKSELVIEIKDTSQGYQPVHKVFEIPDGALNNIHASNVSAMSKKFEESNNNKNEISNGGGGLIPRETIGKKNSIGELSKKFQQSANNNKNDENMRNGCTRRSASIEAVSKVFQNNDNAKPATKHFNATPKPFIHGEIGTKNTIKPVVYVPITNSKPPITSPKPTVCVSPPIKSFETKFLQINGNEFLPPLPPPMPSQQQVQRIPNPPPFPSKISSASKIHQKQDITLNNGNSIFNNGTTTVDGNQPNSDLKKDPRVKKMVYGALREMYGAYHDKANDYIATIPKNRVKKNNGLDNIINSIASQGGLEKLNGRANPSAENEVN